MTKYNEEVFDAALGAYLNFSGTEQDSFEAALDTLERAPWWEEVAGDYGVDFGEPFREECAGRAWERTNEGPYRPISSFAHEGSLFRYFRDTRWRPPVKPLKVGDLIETVAQAESLPIGTIAVSMANETIRKADMDEWRRVNAERGFLLADFEMAGQGDRIIHLPSEVSE